MHAFLSYTELNKVVFEGTFDIDFSLASQNTVGRIFSYNNDVPSTISFYDGNGNPLTI